MSRKAMTLARATAAAAVVTFLIVGLASGCLRALAAPQDSHSSSLFDSSFNLSPASSAVAPLLVKLWNSGFFRRNEAVRGEINKIDYVFFDPQPSLDKRGLACFVPGMGGHATIYLRRDIFAHFEIVMEGVFERQDLAPRILPILVHEFCHDLWTNVLDATERAAFAREGAEFVTDYLLTVTAEEKRLFLLRAGDGKVDLRRMRTYAGLDAMRKMYPPSVLCGQELFAWLAERLFTTKEKIPRPLAEYYVSILKGVPSDGEKGPD